VAVLGEMPLNEHQAKTLADWVEHGGQLITMRPARPLARRLGIRATEGTLSDAYLRIDVRTAAGKGLVNTSIQFHGDADLYPAGSGETIATLYRNESTPAGHPAVLRKHLGRGNAVIFAYNLARSVVYTRQGNPAWSGMERDGVTPVRSDDLFYGAASYDEKPDWVDMKKVAIPQADEQQRLLANLLTLMAAPAMPLPRFWYFPRGLKAVVVMTGDDHGYGGTIGRFQQFKAASPRNCSLDDWQCIRGTSNIFLGSISPEDASTAVREGFEIGLHIFTDCQNWPTETSTQADGSTRTKMSASKSNTLYSDQLDAFFALYPGLPAPTTSRTDCITWGDFDSQPQIELAHGIRLDMNYYYWPAAWVADRPGMFTGSGMPMRFARLDGSLIDVYQAATQMTDESGQSYPYTIDSLLDNALGPAGYYGAFTANIHNDQARSRSSDEILASARRHDVPVVTGQQMLRWLDGRNSSAFQGLSWNAPELHFAIVPGGGARGLTAMLPWNAADNTLRGLELNGTAVQFHKVDFAGMEYASFPAAEGNYVARYTRE
jgi:hypothetical protein